MLQIKKRGFSSKIGRPKKTKNLKSPTDFQMSFVESIYKGQTAVKDREPAIELITYTIHRMRQALQ